VPRCYRGDGQFASRPYSCFHCRRSCAGGDGFCLLLMRRFSATRCFSRLFDGRGGRYQGRRADQLILTILGNPPVGPHAAAFGPAFRQRHPVLPKFFPLVGFVRPCSVVTVPDGWRWRNLGERCPGIQRFTESGPILSPANGWSRCLLDWLAPATQTFQGSASTRAAPQLIRCGPGRSGSLWPKAS
jgi:hypothetical protein